VFDPSSFPGFLGGLCHAFFHGDSVGLLPAGALQSRSVGELEFPFFSLQIRMLYSSHEATHVGSVFTMTVLAVMLSRMFFDFMPYADQYDNI